MNDFHADAHIRINNSRHAAIILKENKILVLYRIKNGKKFYTIPGGHIQQGETGIQAVKREINEETSIETTEPELIFEFKDYKNDRFDTYYLCNWISKEPALNGEEAMKNSPENYYELQWIEINKVSEIDLLPKFAKEWIERNLNV